MTLFEFISGSAKNGKLTSFAGKIVKNDPKKPNMLKFGALPNDYNLGDEVKYYDGNEVYIFGGKIERINESTGVTFLEVADYSIVASQTPINEVYENQTIGAILTDLITEYTDWTITSINIPAVTIKRIVYNEEWLSVAINKLLELVNGSYEINKDNQIRIFVNSAVISAGVIDDTVDVLDGAWEIDNQKRAEKVILRGAIIDQRTTETLT